MYRRARRIVLPLSFALSVVAAVIAVPEPVAAQPVVRIAGPDRYATAALISGQFAPGTPVVFVTSGENYPDAIAAGWRRFPVLLVRRDSVPDVTRNELARLAPFEIAVIGGTAAVSDAVVAELAPYAQGMVRVAGADRYGTAAEIVALGPPPPGPFGTVLVASGTDFADAMLAGAAGAVAPAPLLLVPPNGPLPISVVNALATLAGSGFTTVTIVGGPGDVPPAVEADLANPAPGLTFTVNRVPGNDVYERSVAIWLPLGAGPFDVVLTSGENWPDGLAGSGFTAIAHAAGITTNRNVMVLTRQACVPGIVAAGIAAAAPSRITILGGPAAVSPAVEAGTICP